MQTVLTACAAKADLLNADSRNGHFECTAQINEITLGRMIYHRFLLKAQAQCASGDKSSFPTLKFPGVGRLFAAWRYLEVSKVQGPPDGGRIASGVGVYKQGPPEGGRTGPFLPDFSDVAPSRSTRVPFSFDRGLRVLLQMRTASKFVALSFSRIPAQLKHKSNRRPLASSGRSRSCQAYQPSYDSAGTGRSRCP